MTEFSKKLVTKKRKPIPLHVKTAVLTESGYRCAVPTCRTILAIDLHHMVEVHEGGGDTPTNLISLCPNCHRLFHIGTISREAIYSWKSVLVALSRGFDVEVLDLLLFLNKDAANSLLTSGDGVLRFSRLIAADLAEFQMVANNANQLVTYHTRLTQKGKLLVSAWQAGNRAQLESIIIGSFPPS